MVQVASLRPINAEKTIWYGILRFQMKRMNDWWSPFVPCPLKAFLYIDKGILGLIYDTLLQGNACGLLMCMWKRDLADYALNNM
ncbi:hypothetical protein H0E87_018751 [Populus deltoides]|uniref:Uncharacterized protein n=1 Tax=Populus deltoides TaxID=3696 RepID=A0A8T2XR97_POPDE|nr:hypothetical protein H0E87_018751 [Populus deltoides]